MPLSLRISLRLGDWDASMSGGKAMVLLGLSVEVAPSTAVEVREDEYAGKCSCGKEE